MNTGEVIEDEILDAIDSCPTGTLEGEVPYVGPIATIRHLSRTLDRSEGAIYRALRRLHARGLVVIVDGVDPKVHCRRLFVIGEAVR